MVNKVILVGNVGATPDIKSFDNGQIVSVNLATNETYKDKEGNKQTKTEWHTVQFWGKLGEIVVKYVRKGDPIYIQGKITYREYEKDGVKKYFTAIVANEMRMMGTKHSSETMQELPTGESNKETDVDSLPF